ncbi:MAG TPA: FmdB family zinc ribbon protein [Egibacteraceae bacterium]|jgi:putative FmdB family regulatory protein|nr:FmdB family zinc ribbon protein [Egibacteraceae bacterium]
MPTYEYVCRDCGQHLEVVQSFKDAPLTTCGNCSGALRKVFSAAGIIFKGSGYYVTDTRKKPADSSGTSSDGGSSDKAAKPGTAPGDTAGDTTSSSGPAKGAAESA